MKKRLGTIILLFSMISVFLLNTGQPFKAIVGYSPERDGEIEWQSYSREW